jgi:hypothetical protein
MNDYEIVATYSDQTLAGVIRDLSTGKAWWPDKSRLQAAIHEQNLRKLHEHQQDTQSEQ